LHVYMHAWRHAREKFLLEWGGAQLSLHYVPPIGTMFKHNQTIVHKNG
jgi:hypothetical protein